MAALTVALLFESLRRHAGPVAAWLGAAALALAQPWLVYSAVLEPDLLIGAAVAATIVLLSAEDRGPRRLALAGLALGLAISLRPTALLFGACAVAFLVARKTSWRALSTFGVVTAVAALGPPLALRARAGQDLRTTMSAGQVFHQSHRPESLGFGATFPSLLKVVEGQLATGPHAPDSAHELYRELARVSEPGRVDASAAEVYWLQRACAWFALEPLAATRQLGLKLVFFVAPPAGEYDVPAVQPLLRRALGLPLRWLTLLAVGCLAVLVARRTRPALPWALHWASAAAVALLFYCNGRYAVGLVPSVAALCGLGLGALNEKGRRRWVLVLAVPFLVLALPVVAWSDRLVERLGVIDSGAPGATFEAARARYLEEQAAMPDVFWPTSPPRARGRCRRRRVRAAGRESRARQVRLGLGARRHAGRRAPSSGRALRRGAAAGRPRGRGGLRVGIGRSLRRSGAGGQRLPPEPGPAG